MVIADSSFVQWFCSITNSRFIESGILRRAPTCELLKPRVSWGRKWTVHNVFSMFSGITMCWRFIESRILRRSNFWNRGFHEAGSETTKPLKVYPELGQRSKKSDYSISISQNKELVFVLQCSFCRPGFTSRPGFQTKGFLQPFCFLWGMRSSFELYDLYVSTHFVLMQSSGGTYSIHFPLT